MQSGIEEVRKGYVALLLVLYRELGLLPGTRCPNAPGVSGSQHGSADVTLSTATFFGQSYAVFHYQVALVLGYDLVYRVEVWLFAQRCWIVGDIYWKVPNLNTMLNHVP